MRLLIHPSGTSSNPVKKSFCSQFAPDRLLLTAHRSLSFTLIELMMVMLIMGIVLGVSVPAFNSIMRGSDMRGAVSAVRNTLVQSRQWAITHRENVTFCYDAFTNFYVTNSSGRIQGQESLPRSVQFQGGGSLNTITFKADGGLASGAIPVSISLLGANMTKKISINGLTGGIKVE